MGRGRRCQMQGASNDGRRAAMAAVRLCVRVRVCARVCVCARARACVRVRVRVRVRVCKVGA